MRKLLLLLLLVSPSAFAENFAWDPPTTFTDGSKLDPLVDLKEYHLYGLYPNAAIYQTIPAPASTYKSSALKVGVYSFTITAVSKLSAESDKSIPLNYSKVAPSQMGTIRIGP